MKATRVKRRLTQEGFLSCFSVNKYWCTHGYSVRVLFDKRAYPILSARQEVLSRAEEIVREEYASHFGVQVEFVTPIGV